MEHLKGDEGMGNRYKMKIQQHKVMKKILPALPRVFY